MPGLTIAGAVTPDNTPGGGILTFAIPVGLFAVVAVILYLLFSRPHRRIPARRAARPGRAAVPGAEAARAAAIAGGLSLAAGGGTTESHHEPFGATYAAEAGTGTGVVPGPEPGPEPGPDDPDPADREDAGRDSAAPEGPEAGQ
jgi:hypothetical protein